MRRWGQLFRRLTVLFRRDRFDRDLAEEMQAHLEMQAAENRESGMGGEEARLAARRQFGNAAGLQEASREAWGWRMLDEAARDFRLALRTLRRGPGFAAIAVVTLALGIGLNMAAFTLVYKVVLRPVDYRDVGRLMDVHLVLTDARGTIPMSWSYPKFQELLQWNRSFDAVAAEQANVLTWIGIDEPLTAEIVSARYFRMIGVNAQLGRVFTGLEAAGPRHIRLRNGLVVAQMALALVLLAGADLTIRSFAGLLATNFGVETRNTLTMTVQPRSHDEAARRAFYSELERRAATLPGVEAAAVSDMLPSFGPDWGTGLRVDGRGPAFDTNDFEASPAYFKLFRIPTLAGRVFDERDREDSPRVVVLSESAARRFFPGGNPLGRRIEYPRVNDALAEVIGVVGDVKYSPPEARARPTVYSSTLQSQPGSFLEVRAARDPRMLVPALRKIARVLDPEVRVYDVRTMDQVTGLATWRARLTAVLLGLMGALSLALAAVGIYGVFSYAVAARSREIGVRIALGAGRERILGMVLREGAALSGAALLLGLPAAWLLTRTLSSQLYRISPADPAAYISVAALLLAFALLACYLPARRATRVDPVEALRHE